MNMTEGMTSGQCRRTEEDVAPVAAKCLLLMVTSWTPAQARATKTNGARTARQTPIFFRVSMGMACKAAGVPLQLIRLPVRLIQEKIPVHIEIRQAAWGNSPAGHGVDVPAARTASYHDWLKSLSPTKNFYNRESREERECKRLLREIRVIRG